MPQTQLKTQPNKSSVIDFLNSLENPKKRDQALELLELFQKVTGDIGQMWGSSIIGFGSYEYTNTLGTNRWMATGFSPRKQNFSIYIMPGYHYQEMTDLLQSLGSHKVGKSCLYIKDLTQVKIDVLEEIIKAGLQYLSQKYTVTGIST